ncbi:sensor histidine kinase [Cellulosimicrobium marinum]|uniref:sensor histidine kinase n=1 Tax=Cellulosimicrobium marinum TaxID=1638992 RepID=UPI001E514C09|nr:histidine kinase [Cellulosimicrobium marinum]MCB7137925.1 histidine kinase [Cellulosimicrobium marinum]
MGSSRTFLESWTRRSAPARFDMYTRWSLYLLSAGEPFVALFVLASDPGFSPTTVVPWLLVAVAHTVACLLVLRGGIDQFLGGPHVPRWRLVALGILSVALVMLALVTFPVDGPDGVAGSGRFWALLLGPGFGVLAVTPLVAYRRLALVALLLAVGLGCSVWIGTGPVTATTAGMAVGLGLSFLVMLLALFASYRASIWMLGVVWEQERNRVLHARLAVAEERLRFSRDLHDVFGRTLSVVAVKSELAAELAARGRPGAEEQMLDVRRIAQDALREVRAVVAGYRTADLAAELAGARSVLRSAGVATTVHGDETPVGDAAQEALAWAVRESVTNVVRHSAATSCTITLHHDGGASVLEVVNDGVPPGTRAGRGSGLLGLAERLDGTGGSLDTWTDDGRFGLVARVPDAGPRARTGPTPPARTTEKSPRA